MDQQYMDCKECQENSNSVHYEQCKIINTVCKKVERCPELWVACAKGHIDCVKFFIEKWRRC